ncbi:MAG: tetratricopeptide repeat protein, partial [Gemmataceae bacterium]
MYIVLGVVAAAGLLALLYYALAPGPVRARAHARAKKLLDAGDWREALAVAEPLLAANPPPAWRTKLRHLAGECHQRGLEEAIKAGEYETGRGHAVRVAELLEQDEAEQISRVVEAALAEVRRRFAKQTEPVIPTLERVEKLAGKVPPEANFWRALCLLRDGDLDTALMLLTDVSGRTGKDVIDPPLYVGLILHRLGRPAEALKWLSDANRIDGNCPLVTWQIGVTLMVSGGDSGIAMRALQRAMGPRGLPLWQREPGRLWIEGLPEGRSFIRRLAAKNGDPKGVTFPCPLLGTDLNVLIRQGNLALAQALYNQARFGESADLYGQLLQNAPPTPLLLRGYGLALARAGQFDAAFKQLVLALEQENPKDPFTAGYLALCAAMGRPTNADDRPRNIAWGLKLLSRHPVLENAEWAGLVRDVHGEARKAGMTLSLDDQELLCDALASVQAADPKAAAALAHLAMTHPEAIKPVYAWLYVRAATAHHVTSPVDLEMFARTFQDVGKARNFFDQHKWDLGESEYVYLERAAKRAPGQFPEVMGADYPPRGEAFLLARSRTE